MKKYLRIVASSLTVLIAVALSAAVPATAMPEPKFTYHLASGNYGPGLSYLSSFTDGEKAGRLCSKVGSVPCKPSSKTQVDANMVAPVCTARETNCIDDFYAIFQGQKVAAEFKGYVSDTVVLPDTKWGLLGEGRADSLWQIPGVLNSAGTDTYMVHAVYFAKLVGQKFEIQDYALKISPYEAKASDDAKDMVVNTDASTTYLPKHCAFTQTQVCGQLADFPAESRFGVTLRLQNEVSNWFNARVSSPDYGVAKFDARSKTVTIEASPTVVPLFSASLTQGQVPAKVRNFLSKFGNTLKFPGLIGKEADDTEALASVDAFRAVLHDTATSTQTMWAVQNLRGQNRKCLDSQTEIQGFVSTNAMTIQSEPPVFKGGFIQYEVAGMHYLPDGTNHVGEYDLVIRSSVARCLFDIPQVPLSATVTVSTTNGSKSTATTVVSEKNGWLKLSAKGFTFSKKTIKVKITKKK